MCKIVRLVLFNFFTMKVKKSLAGIASGTLMVFALPIAATVAFADTGTTATDTTSGTMQTTASTQAFSDVSPSNPEYTALQYLKDHGVIGGYSDGTFKPDQTVNRAEALKIILLGSGIQVAASVDLEPFRDTDRSAWYAPYVSKAKDLNVVSGYADGTFKPAQTVNLVENLKMLLLTGNININNLTVTQNPYADAPKGQWYTNYAEYAKEKNLIDADSKNMVYPAQGMTRGKLAEMMYRLMYMKAQGWDKFMTGTQETLPVTTQVVTQETQMSTEQSTQQQSNNVSIVNMAFSPAALNIKTGSTVVWTNQDTVTHSVTSDDGTTFSSGNLANGSSFSFTFSKPGTYTYHCAIHTFMTGSVTVTN